MDNLDSFMIEHIGLSLPIKDLYSFRSCCRRLYNIMFNLAHKKTAVYRIECCYMRQLELVRNKALSIYHEPTEYLNCGNCHKHIKFPFFVSYNDLFEDEDCIFTIAFCITCYYRTLASLCRNECNTLSELGTLSNKDIRLPRLFVCHNFTQNLADYILTNLRFNST